jgi:hypothetical protein
VTIRLDFEIQKHSLPAIYHKLCWLLMNVLHGHNYSSYYYKVIVATTMLLMISFAPRVVNSREPRSEWHQSWVGCWSRLDPFHDVDLCFGHRIYVVNDFGRPQSQPFQRDAGGARGNAERLQSKFPLDP